MLVLDEANAHRFVQYKICEILFLIAREEPAQADPATAALTAYKGRFASGWEIVPALKMLGQLLEEKGDTQAASQAYAELSALPDVPKKVKQEGDMLAVRVLLRGGQYADAEKRLKELQLDLPPNDPQRTYADVCLVQAQLAQGNLDQIEPRLQAALKATSDPAVRAVAHNLLGDYYRVKGQLDPAFWNYLRVDVLYNQDREETAKALYHLSKLFDKAKKDLGRAEDCLRRLKGPEFAGTAFQRKANEEK
jgi:tetratricopeptide (TPR) repeat protein